MSKANEAGIQHIDSNEDAQVGEKGQYGHTDVLRDEELLNEAYRAENAEHAMGLWEAVKTHPMACMWAFLMAFTIVSCEDTGRARLTSQVMESFDMFLVGNFVALPAFKERFGVQLDGKWVIETKWQSALFQAGQCGAFVGVFAAGPVTNKLGYKWTTFCALVAMICTIFISFFVSLKGSQVTSADDVGNLPIRPHCWSIL
jgi:SP family general alpha glucoside:H+ symporter-like MFS transporter